MRVLAINPGHDGSIALIENRKLVFAFESEKDSFPRHAPLSVDTFVQALEHCGERPDLVGVSGWWKQGPVGSRAVGAGYFGQEMQRRAARFLGKDATLFSSTHERSHIMASLGMAPRDEAEMRVVLVWEGAIGGFYLVDRDWNVVRGVPVLGAPGTRYSFLYGLADPSFPDHGAMPNGDDSGKLMALAGFGSANEADQAVAETVERILLTPKVARLKHSFHDSPLHNAGVEAGVTKTAAALLNERIFEVFANAAREHLPAGLPLHIGGGCGLNCDWNTAWRELGHFSSVFVPPCPNDSGSAIGTAIDALTESTGDPYLDWDVYCGLEFEWDADPDPARWERRPLDVRHVAEALREGRIVAWVQGRAELGPRALGNRSLLAEPFDPSTRDRLNQIKKREPFRPIAPCCRLEDVGRIYDRSFEDPYMLYFRTATVDTLGAVTHVDGSARCQTVTPETNEPLYELLSAFADVAGIGVLCNTSLNFKGLGFINRTSDLLRYCQDQRIFDFVVGDSWFQRAGKRASGGPASTD